MDKGNPYAPPDARVVRTAIATTALVLEPRRVAPGRGAQWLGGGIGLLVSAPATWLLVCLAFAVIYGVQMVVLIGTAFVQPRLVPLTAILMIMPVTLLAGGVLAACHSPHFHFAVVVSSLARRATRLLALGFVIVALSIVVGAIFLALLLLAGSGVFDINLSSAVAGKISVLVGFFLSLLLAGPVFMAAWFAPALVAIADQSPLRAIALSFQGCRTNLLPLAVYLLLALALFIMASIIISIIGLLIASLFARLADAGLLSAWLQAGAIVFYTLVPACAGTCLIWATQYCAFRDIFVHDADSA